MLRSLFAIFALLGVCAVPAAAQEAAHSECLAMSNVSPRAVPVSFRQAAAASDEVAITYAGHSTYFIDTPGGVRIATDYSGAYQVGRLPDVVTMNRAHSTHYTLFPDPRIPHVLHGWGDDGEPARINQRIGDVLIRNVTTFQRFHTKGFVLVDALLGYDLGKANTSLEGWSLAINAANLLDKTHISACPFTNSCYYGAARTVIGSIRYNW